MVWGSFNNENLAWKNLQEHAFKVWNYGATNYTI
jgi:hypothetical protein